MSGRAVCRDCGEIGESRGLGAVSRCECGGLIVPVETAADRLRALRREAEREGLTKPRPISETISPELFERTREELTAKGILPRRGL